TDARGLVYSYAFIGIKRLGTAQFYLMTIKDKDGHAFDGGKTYRLTVAAKAPVKQYWSATVYDRATHALVRDLVRASRSSQVPDLQKTADGSVDLYLGPKAPAGRDSNWSPRNPVANSRSCSASTVPRSRYSTRRGGCRTSRGCSESRNGTARR